MKHKYLGEAVTLEQLVKKSEALFGTGSVVRVHCSGDSDGSEEQQVSVLFTFHPDPDAELNSMITITSEHAVDQQRCIDHLSVILDAIKAAGYPLPAAVEEPD